MHFDRARAKLLVEQLFKITDELHAMTERPFTPDGHLVGSLGEVIAANAYDLILERPSTTGCDAKSRDGRRIEVKATFGTRMVAFRRHDADCEADHCLVLKLGRNGDFDTIYNGPMKPILDQLRDREPASNGQITVSLAKLKEWNRQVSDSHRLIRADERNVGTQ